MDELSKLFDEYIDTADIFEDDTGSIAIVIKGNFISLIFNRFAIRYYIQIPCNVSQIIFNLTNTGYKGANFNFWKNRPVSIDTIMRSIYLNDLLDKDNQEDFDDFYINTYCGFSENLKNKIDNLLQKVCYINDNDRRNKISRLKVELMSRKNDEQNTANK